MMVNAMKVWAMKVFVTRNYPDRAAGRWLLSALALGGVLSFAAPAPTWAQMGGVGQPGGGLGQPGGGHSQMPKSEPEPPPLPAPDAVPGAKARSPAAPATHAPTDLQPTDALFDAINRGDIAAARDALNRGADMDGVNVLGMTPMELSVDLGRNDISFLLLSMRGEDTGRGSRAVGRDVAEGSMQGRARAKTAAVAKSSPTTKATAPTTPVIARSVAKPKMLANDGGTPLPSAGFLGFDPRSSN
jgi:hypothetical protein